MLYGVRGVRLESVVIGGRRYTLVEALDRYAAGCTARAAGAPPAASLSTADVSPERANGNGHHRGNGKPTKKQVAVYRYDDETGAPLFRKIRYEPKSFFLQRCVGPDKWEWGIPDVRRVLYRLRRIVNADPQQWVYVVEGEKDVERAEMLGLLATCNFDVAAQSTESPKWRDEYNEHLRGRHVIVPDSDNTGRAHATAIARSLHGTAASIRVLTLPGLPDGGDLSDWCNAGGTDEQLGELTEACPIWQPGEAPAEKTDDGDEWTRIGPPLTVKELVAT